MNKVNSKIAVIGMACRLPGANSIDEYWKNLLDGKDTIKRFSDDELSKFEFRYDEIKDDPNFVKARGILDNIDKFDSEFFGMTPSLSARTDPQHRVWLETAWEAFENAGCDPVNYPGKISVFAGGCSNTYLLNNILRDQKTLENYIRLRKSDSFQLFTGNDVSFIPTKTAYHFNLMGAAINVQTTCSTSLVAISESCQSLSDNKSDICLAGAVCILVPQESGYMYQDGAIYSPEGYCRPYDAKARGTVFSNGVGAVILKRFDDAVRDHDRIYAVVRGWATNNDGSNKISYTAPSIDGQAEVIMLAHASADISPEEISYIETHGTGTQIGDPIEISGLKKAFELKTTKKQFCGIGSVKSNIGHTDVAAGVASFIKSCLIAYHKRIPPLINFSVPNPYIDFENSPFYIQKDLRVWNEEKPLILGVSSFGIGGTNAHAILEEPPVRDKLKSSTSEWPQLVLLSAKSEIALNRRKEDLIDFLKAETELNIHDVAFTLQAGRNHMPFRSFVVAEDIQGIISDKKLFTSGKTDNLISDIAFMFPGQGAQYIPMGKDLYYSSRIFREVLDECFEIIKSETGENLKALLFESNNIEDAGRRLASTGITQPVLFTIEYALVKLLEQFNIKPKYLIGHSIGEYTSACVAGVFDMKTALKIVIKRGQLMEKMPSGSMMAVKTSADKLKDLDSSYFELAADNAPGFCTISFKSENAESVKKLMEVNGISCILLNTSHAFHSEIFDPILSEFSEFIKQFTLKTPELPFISCLTGKFITPEQAVSGDYWASQLRHTVHFREGISTIANAEDIVFLEVGPETHLSSLVRQNNDVTNKKSIISTLGKFNEINEQYKILGTLGNLFNLGIKVDFDPLFKEPRPDKISLPTYPFERNRHWIDFELPPDEIKESSPVKLFRRLFRNGRNGKGNNGNGISTFKEKAIVSGDAHGLNTLTPTEQAIFNIWSEAFMTKDISITDNFFERGGDSLLAITVMAKVRAAFKIDISLKALIENPRIKDLAEKVDAVKL